MNNRENNKGYGGYRSENGRSEAKGERGGYGRRANFKEENTSENSDRNSRRHNRREDVGRENHRRKEEVAFAAEESEANAEEESSRIEGRNAVLEAYRAGRTIERLYILDGNHDGPIGSILREAKKQDTIISYVKRERLDAMSETGKHQGVIAVAAAYKYAEVEGLLANARIKGEDPFLILLDDVEDPHNLGAIIRTANCVGAHGVIIPKRRSVGLTPAAVKASAGAVNYTPVARVTNLSDTIRRLKEEGIWFVCADMAGEVMYRQKLTGPIGLVVGNEGAGVSRLVKENCDFITSIPMKGDIDSLNASVAAGVLAYEIARQRMI